VPIIPKSSALEETNKHPFNGLFSRTTWVIQHQKGRTILDFNEARDDGVAVESVGLYTGHVHLTANRQPRQHIINFYRPDGLPDTQPTALKH